MKKTISRRNFIKKYSKNVLSISIASYFTIPINVIPLYANETLSIDNIHNKHDLIILSLLATK